MDENAHPKGALLFIAIYLLLLTALWTNAYLHHTMTGKLIVESRS